MNSDGHYVAIDLDNDDRNDDFTPFDDAGLVFKKMMSYRENEEFIINQLVQLGFSLRAAMLCVQITGSKDLDHILQFITSDENGFYNHPYLEQEMTSSCIICSDSQDRHVDSLDPYEFEHGISHIRSKLLFILL